jgi:SpoVK/Ycf46/Vps4 family AAA+-type ATPase
MPLPAFLLTNKAKLTSLYDYLVAHSVRSTSSYVNAGDRIVVLAGAHDDHSNLYNKGQAQYIAASVARIEGSKLNVQWDDGSTWWLNTSGRVVPLAVLEKYLRDNDVPVELDTSHLDKLVLDEKNKAEIVSVLKQHNNFKKIFEEWGLADVMEYGKAMSLLFYGPPGTGKTWAANCIAKALNKELFVVSAAEIQTSEPGGANRNIIAAFQQAKIKSAVLFLDECDGLITDRSHVGMILASEINTLLTELEKFEGVVVFATNRCDTLDPAMARRISLMVEFNNPTKAQRKDIWEVLLPKKMPLADDVSLEKLATFDLTGGYIKNAILNAARTAAAEEAPAVSMKHFAAAIKRIKDTKDIMGTHTSRREDFVKARG